jgi:leucyl/phenylalanyl-tRNA--protein transferase
MPAYLIPEDHVVFPHPLLSEEDGLLGLGGSLTPDRLLLAYHFGIFPWFNPGERVQWFFPNPRSVIFSDEIHVQKSMRPYFNHEKLHWSVNLSFDQVIRACQNANDRAEEGTWIGDEILAAYSELNRRGVAHSIEVWRAHELVGGFYGVWIGKIFFGESMFSLENNASKFGLISFVKYFSNLNRLHLVDCQIGNDYLESLGARDIDGQHFLDLIKKWAWSSR